METRNFKILVAAICIGLTAFWLTAYNVVRLGIDPIEYIQESSKTTISEESDDQEEEIVITFIGKVKEELKLTLDELKSDKYKQITAVFDFKNSYGTEWSIEYTGATLWSILALEGILESDAQTFIFIGKDGYESPIALSIEDIAKNYEDQVILAYEIEGDPLFEDGPVRSVIDREVIQNLEPNHYNSQFSVKHLKYVEIG